jgi:hypothetical protein
LLGEEAGSEGPVSADIDAAKENDESHAANYRRTPHQSAASEAYLPVNSRLYP